MKFVDEAIVRVKAGNGGNGCLSFRREKFVAKGGPDGGDGGNGGSVYLVAHNATNTLADFSVARRFNAENGTGGAGRNKTGKGGSDLEIVVPCGTIVYDVDTGETIGDLTELGQRLKVAEGGRAGSAIRVSRAAPTGRRDASRRARPVRRGTSSLSSS